MVVPVPAILLLGPQDSFLISLLLSAYLYVLIYLTHREYLIALKSDVFFGLSAAPVASYFVYGEWVWVSLTFSSWKKDQDEISRAYLLTLCSSCGWHQCSILSTSNVGLVAYPVGPFLRGTVSVQVSLASFLLPKYQSPRFCASKVILGVNSHNAGADTAFFKAVVHISVWINMAKLVPAWFCFPHWGFIFVRNVLLILFCNVLIPHWCC